MLQLLSRAEVPVAILGGTHWSAEAVVQFTQVAERLGMPVAVSFRRKMLFPADHPCFIGDGGLGSNPDIMRYIQGRRASAATGRPPVGNPQPGVYPAGHPATAPDAGACAPRPPAELNRVYRADEAINSTLVRFIEALDATTYPEGFTPSGGSKDDAAHAGLVERLLVSYLAWTFPDDIRTPGALQLGPVMAYLQRTLPADAIMTNGAGNYAT